MPEVSIEPKQDILGTSLPSPLAGQLDDKHRPLEHLGDWQAAVLCDELGLLTRFPVSWAAATVLAID
jgi:hypothetical protein